MARKLQFKRGPKARLPALAQGEPGFVTDEGKLYVGTGNGNIGLARDDHTHTAAQVGADPAGSAAGVQAGLNAHAARRDNPHGVTAAQIGAVGAGSKATQAAAQAGTDDSMWMTPARTKDAYTGKIGEVLKAGDILPTMRTNPGPGFVLCNGTIVNRDAYPGLQNLLPNTPNLYQFGAKTPTNIVVLNVIDRRIYYAYGNCPCYSDYPYTSSIQGADIKRSVYFLGASNGYFWIRSGDVFGFSTDLWNWAYTQPSYGYNVQSYVFSSVDVIGVGGSSSATATWGWYSLSEVRAGGITRRYTTSMGAPVAQLSSAQVLFSGGLYNVGTDGLSQVASVYIPSYDRGWFCTNRYLIARANSADPNYYAFDRSSGANVGVMVNGSALETGGNKMSCADYYGIANGSGASLVVVDALNRIILPVNGVGKNIDLRMTFDDTVISFTGNTRTQTTGMGLVVPSIAGDTYYFMKA